MTCGPPSRLTAFPGFSASESARYGGSTGQVFGELGYRIGMGPGYLEPFVGAAALRIRTDAFREDGFGGAALTGRTRDNDLATTTLGLKGEVQLGQLAGLPLGRRRVKASKNPVVGRWRISEADLWDRDHLDLCGPATLVIRANGDGEIASGAMQASLDVDYGPDEIGFTWTGLDEMTEVSGAGSAELQDNGSLHIEFDYHLGDEAVLKAVHKPSSTAY